MNNITNAGELYVEFIRDLYNAEVLMVSGLLHFKQLVHKEVIKELLQQYLNDSRAHMQKLEDIMEDNDISLLEEHCRSMRSLIEESRELVDRCKEGPVRDFAIAAMVQ